MSARVCLDPREFIHLRRRLATLDELGVSVCLVITPLGVDVNGSRPEGDGRRMGHARVTWAQMADHAERSLLESVDDVRRQLKE